MFEFDVDTVLLDIEGTLSPIDFVHKVLFPFARSEMESFLHRTWNEPTTQDACRRLLLDSCRAPVFDAELEGAFGGVNASAKAEIIQRLLSEAYRLMDGDVKATGLKELQGLIWKQGYAEGKLKSQIYPDVLPSLERWRQQNIAIAIYSSGSVTAQQSFFAHTEHGDLTKYLSAFFDTNTGPKKDEASYTKIAAGLARKTGRILFISDVAAELHAAQASGMRTLLSIRPGNNPADAGSGFPPISSLEEIKVAARA